jgi:hypothetical protein
MVHPAKKATSSGKVKSPFPSPTKKKKKDMPRSLSNGSNTLTLKIVGFCEPFDMEAIFYERSPDKDGFLHGVTRYMKGDFGLMTNSDFDNANFIEIVDRRMRNSANEKFMDGQFSRKVAIRIPPNGESTPASRLEGLEAFAKLLHDTRFQTYPPRSLVKLDITDETNYAPLDDFFMDETIKVFLENNVETSDLDVTFVSKFPDFARKCWGGVHFSDFAISLGFD